MRHIDTTVLSQQCGHYCQDHYNYVIVRLQTKPLIMAKAVTESVSIMLSAIQHSWGVLYYVCVTGLPFIPQTFAWSKMELW